MGGSLVLFIENMFLLVLLDKEIGRVSSFLFPGLGCQGGTSVINHNVKNGFNGSTPIMFSHKFLAPPELYICMDGLFFLFSFVILLSEVKVSA